MSNNFFHYKQNLIQDHKKLNHLNELRIKIISPLQDFINLNLITEIKYLEKIKPLTSLIFEQRTKMDVALKQLTKN